jgi:hypothetical protein
VVAGNEKVFKEILKTIHPHLAAEPARRIPATFGWIALNMSK